VGGELVLRCGALCRVSHSSPGARLVAGCGRHACYGVGSCVEWRCGGVPGVGVGVGEPVCGGGGAVRVARG